MKKDSPVWHLLAFSVILLMLLSACPASAEWSQTPPDSVYITKTQYRSRTRETMTSDQPSQEGWSLAQEVVGNWGEWISNGTNVISSGADREVRIVHHDAVTSITGYSYRRYKYYNSSNGLYYLTYSQGWADSMGFSGSWEYTTVSAANRLSPYKQYDGVQAYGNSGGFWFYETPVTTVAAPAYDEYQYRVRTRSYILSRWTDWSAWQDEAIAASENVEVETRVLYQPDSRFLPSTIVVGRVQEITLIRGMACQLRYENNGPALLWSSSDPLVASVDGAGYLSAHQEGSCVVTVSGRSIDVHVLAGADLVLPDALTAVEGSAFEGGSFTAADLKNAAVIGDRALAGNEDLRLVIVDQPDGVSPTAFEGSPNAVMAAGTRPGNARIPYFVIGEARAYIRGIRITLSETAVTLRPGAACALSAEVSPLNATDRSILWKSSDTAIASVSPAGTVTGLKPGNAVVTAYTAEGLEAACSVTVAPVRVSSIALDRTSLTLAKGNTAALTATVLPSDATDRGIRWSSSNTGVATVSASGVVTGMGAGTAVITASSTDGSNISASCSVTVIPNSVAGDGNFVSVSADGITQTDATVRFTISVSHNPSEGGFYFGTSPADLRLIKSESYGSLTYNVQNV